MKRLMPQTPGRSAPRKYDARAQLEALVAECPLLGFNLPNCPLNGVRKLSPAKARTWLAGLNTEEKSFLAHYHRCCLAVSAEALLRA